jgi:hypothetical protein
MKRHVVSRMVLLALSCGAAVVSCKPSTNATERGAGGDYQSYAKEAASENDFTPWMSKAQVQVEYEKPREGKYFSLIEGRDNGGLSEYRYVLKPFPGTKYSQWAVFWGLSADEFYQVDLKMLRSGFVRDHTQVFRDAAGKSHHQVVWLKKENQENKTAVKP